MKDTFPVCVDILNEERCPIEYRELTELMLSKIGIRKSDIDFEKEIENIREKLLKAGQRGTFYAPRPYCMGAMRYWFNTDQLQFNMDSITIQGNAKAGVDGAFEVLMRPFQTHNTALAHTELLNRQRASGVVLEKHISAWFMENYPEFYRPPDNDGKWVEPCGHDFKLVVGDNVYLVDVAGPDYKNSYGLRGKKKPTDLHLVCRIQGSGCLFEGVARGEKFGSVVIPETITSPTALLVWLNCRKRKIDYRAIASFANQHEERTYLVMVNRSNSKNITRAATP